MINKKTMFLSFTIVLSGLMFFALPASVWAAEANFPAPTLLVPAAGTPLGQDRVWVGGVVKNNSLVSIFIDGQKYGMFPVKNHVSGTASFGFELKNLDLGNHAVTATAESHQGKTSLESNTLDLVISLPTPAPTLSRPVVNGDAGIERPFIVGLVKNNLEVQIVLDDRIVARLRPEEAASGTASFTWQSETPLALGRHKIEALASDNGKLSNNAKAVYWPVGDIGKVAGEAASPAREAATPLTVKETLEAPRPPVVVNDAAGRIDAGNGQGDEEKKLSQADGVKEIAPGAVVRVPTENGSERRFVINNSLIVGITILVFLLLSIIVWYIQEKKEKLGDKVTSLFREAEGQPTLPEAKETKGPTDLPPPPPPVF